MNVATYLGVRFLRHAESIGPIPAQELPHGPVSGVTATGRHLSPGYETSPKKDLDPPIVRDEFRPAIPRTGCSPALPASASPARPHYHALPPLSGATGHFYFAENRTFLLCADTPLTVIDTLRIVIL